MKTAIARAAACVVVVFCLCATASADSLDVWRREVTAARQLADNDARQAYRQAQQLNATQPADATPVDQARILNVLARIETYLALSDLAARHV
jgi:Sec-independent protein secretion pathway component TatC